MSGRMHGPVPTVGKIVGCRFPHEENPNTPGDKFRPAFVCAVSQSMEDPFPRLKVIYGTAQNTSVQAGHVKNEPWHFELEPGGSNQLTQQTRFDCSRFVWLPFTPEWFGLSDTSKMCKTYGEASKDRHEEIRAAIKSVAN